MGASRLEINIQRLLNKCEIMAKDDPNKDWRLEKYLKSLDGMLFDLQKLPIICKPEKDKLSDYNRRCNFLKGLIKTLQMTSPAEKVVAAQMLSHGPATAGGDNMTKEIHQKTTAKYGAELRAELFGNERVSDGDGTVRSRSSRTKYLTENNGEDLDTLIKYHHTMQEKIAEEMLSLTQNLKEQSQLASHIIKKDTEVVTKSAKMTDQNLASLKVESQTLAEHNKRAWKCSLLMMIVIVIVVFISMVMFMKIFRKRIS